MKRTISALLAALLILRLRPAPISLSNRQSRRITPDILESCGHAGQQYAAGVYIEPYAGAGTLFGNGYIWRGVQPLWHGKAGHLYGV